MIDAKHPAIAPGRLGPLAGVALILAAAHAGAQSTAPVEPVFDAGESTSLFSTPGAAASGETALPSQPVPPRVIELDRIVAVVNDDVIVSTELARRFRMVEDQLAQTGTQAPPRNVLLGQVLERLIMERLQIQLADELGVRVDDQTLNRAIDTIAGQNNLTLPQFREVLEREGFSFAEFREDIRKELLVARVHERQVASRVQVSERDIDNFLATSRLQAQGDTQFRLAHILVALPQTATSAQLEQANARAEAALGELRNGADFASLSAAISSAPTALEVGELGWRSAGQLPSIFSEAVLALEPGEVSGVIRSPSGFHIVKLLDKRGAEAEGSVVQQSRVRHILVRTNESTTEADARARLEQLRRRLEGGDDFSDLARSHSDDTTSAARGGELGWITRDKVVPRFYAALETLPEGEVSAPFQTEFGWHIVEVLERRQHDDTSEVLRAKAAEQLRQRRVEEELQTWMRQLRDEAYVEYRLEDE